MSITTENRRIKHTTPPSDFLEECEAACGLVGIRYGHGSKQHIESTKWVSTISTKRSASVSYVAQGTPAKRYAVPIPEARPVARPISTPYPIPISSQDSGNRLPTPQRKRVSRVRPVPHAAAMPRPISTPHLNPPSSQDSGSGPPLPQSLAASHAPPIPEAQPVPQPVGAVSIATAASSVDGEQVVSPPPPRPSSSSGSSTGQANTNPPNGAVPDKGRQPWTDEEKAYLASEVMKKTPFAAIGQALGRSPVACRIQKHNLQLPRA